MKLPRSAQPRTRWMKSTELVGPDPLPGVPPFNLLLDYLGVGREVLRHEILDGGPDIELLANLHILGLLPAFASELGPGGGDHLRAAATWLALVDPLHGDEIEIIRKLWAVVALGEDVHPLRLRFLPVIARLVARINESTPESPRRPTSGPREEPPRWSRYFGLARKLVMALPHARADVHVGEDEWPAILDRVKRLQHMRKSWFVMVNQCSDISLLFPEQRSAVLSVANQDALRAAAAELGRRATHGRNVNECAAAALSLSVLSSERAEITTDGSLRTVPAERVASLQDSLPDRDLV